MRWFSIGLAAACMAGSLGIVPASGGQREQAETSGYDWSEPTADGGTEEEKTVGQRLSKLTEKLIRLNERRAHEREDLETLKNEQTALEKEEKELRVRLNESIRMNYEASSDAETIRKLIASGSSEGSAESPLKETEEGAAENPSVMLEHYEATYEAYLEKTAEVQKKRVAIRQLDSQIASLEAPADELGAELQRQKAEEAERKLAEKQAEAGTLTATTVREYLGTFTTTGYCPCAICCGEYGTGAAAGYTASGTKAAAGRTVAMGGVPFGTKLEINGHIYTVEDRGTPYGHVDVYYNTHSEAESHGLQQAKVYLITE